MTCNPSAGRPPRLRSWHVLAVAAAVALAATGTAAAAASPATPRNGAVSRPAGGLLASAGTLSPQPACDAPAPGSMACLAIVDTGLHWTGHGWAIGHASAAQPRTPPPDTVPATAAAASPAPYMAAGLQSAYRLRSALLGARQTIAIVDAGDDPNAAPDLAAYRAANHLPACDANFPCFEKVNQEGRQGNYPPVDPGWPVEESLDVDMVSAICPNCKIILVEADDGSDASIGRAEDEAARLGANVISNSYSEPEQDMTAGLAADYDHPGVAITAASGDSGLGVSVPAAFSTVTAVGGTTLYRDRSPRGWAELAWRYSGSGCSAYVPKPAWQHDRLCGMRTVADVAAVADPDTPVAVYDTYGAYSGWIAVGGTSVASPVIAGVYALAGNAATIGQGAAWIYAHARGLFDVTYQPALADIAPQSTGDCGGSYLCTAGPGYDGPTGWGTPDGTGAF